MRILARTFLIAILVAGLMNLPLLAASEKPLGMVVLASNAHLDSADAAMGANVYTGDALETAAGGTLRVKIGTGQLYMLSESRAQFMPGETGAYVKLFTGTMGFSAAASDGISIETPVGVVRAEEGQRAFGQVTLVNPRKMIVAAYTGALVVERGTNERVIEEGKTYEVSLPAEPAAQKYGVTPAFNDKLLLKAIVGGGVAVAGFFVWCAESESDYQPPCH